jgi:hypothetical protein
MTEGQATEHKSFQAPDETRDFPNGRAEFLYVGGADVELVEDFWPA